MSSNTLTPAIIWAAGQAAKVAIRRSTNPRVGAPIEDVIERGTRYLLKQVGAGGLAAHSEGAAEMGPVSREAAAAYWQAVAQRDWGVYVVVGQMGSGKSAVCAMLAQIIEQYQGKPSLWLGPDQRVLDTLALSAESLSRDDLVERMESGAIHGTTVVIEDAMRHFSAWTAHTPATQALHEFLAVGCRKQGNVCILNTQSAAIVAKHVLPTAVYCKRPHMAAADEERGGQLARSKRAERAFDLLGSEAEEKRYVWVEDPMQRFRGLVIVPLVPRWSEAFSRAT